MDIQSNRKKVASEIQIKPQDIDPDGLEILREAGFIWDSHLLAFRKKLATGASPCSIDYRFLCDQKLLVHSSLDKRERAGQAAAPAHSGPEYRLGAPTNRRASEIKVPRPIAEMYCRDGLPRWIAEMRRSCDHWMGPTSDPNPGAALNFANLRPTSFWKSAYSLQKTIAPRAMHGQSSSRRGVLKSGQRKTAQSRWSGSRHLRSAYPAARPELAEKKRPRSSPGT